MRCVMRRTFFLPEVVNMSRSTRAKKQEEKPQEKPSWMNMFSGNGLGDIASIAQTIAERLTKAEEFLERCEKQSTEALQVAKAANQKDQKEDASKLNTKLNEIMARTDKLQVRIKDLQTENDKCQSKIETLNAKLDAVLDGYAAADRYEWNDTS